MGGLLLSKTGLNFENLMVRMRTEMRKDSVKII